MTARKTPAIEPSFGNTKNRIAIGLFSFQMGGSERLGSSVAKELSRRGHDVICFAFYDSHGPIRDSLESAGIRCFDLNFEARNKRVRKVSYPLELAFFLRRHRINALHVHHATSLILSGLSAFIAGVPRVVMTEHDLRELQRRHAYLQQSRRHMRFATAVTVVHNDMKQFFQDHLDVPWSKLSYIANAIEPIELSQDARSGIRSELGVSPSTIVFCFVGRLSPVKDLPTLIKAFCLLPDTVRRDAQVWLVGDGPERNYLQQLCAESNLGHQVQFLGQRNDAQVIMSAADIFVMSSISEGQPMAMLEAMGAGLPCIATAVGGIPDLLADGIGLLVPESDSHALSRAMSTLALDPSARQRLGSAARARVQSQHGFTAMVSAYEALLTDPDRARNLQKAGDVDDRSSR